MLYTRRSSAYDDIYICDAINNADTSFCRAGKRFIDIIYRYRMSCITSVCMCLCVCVYSYVYIVLLCLGDFFDIYSIPYYAYVCVYVCV